ncbi:G-rich sequence factor 1 [Cottoperca gobio]|uniref:G-rich sequence factor 1 n=1 Tax=Cottoperca gobio TaxID=56716 RepID=A0A6J2QE22_COTGO|nr:G-rich sequence factor 1 [Cottoperca gobio]
MSRNSKSLLCLLQRCVAVRKVTLPKCLTTRWSSNSSVLSAGFGSIQQPTPTPRAVFHLQSTVRTSQYRFCTKAGEPWEDEYPPLQAYQLDPEPVKKDVYIMKVKGLPYSCSAQDLLQFFSECRIRDGVNGIHLTENRNGRPSGEAFIEMEHEEDVRKALEKHRQYLGPRYVEVYEVNNGEEATLKKALAQAEDGVVRLRGLPYYCNKEEIVHFFSGLDIVENGITFINNRRGKNYGEAFVQFSSQKEADKALERDREVIGNRYIEVFPSSSEQILSKLGKRQNVVSSYTGPQSANERTVSASHTEPGSTPSSALPLHYIHMRGLPFQVSGEDIVKFFAPLVVSKIVIECSPLGRLSGEAEVHFRCHQDCLTAMSRDKQYIGERFIELFLNSVVDSD